MLLTHQTFVLTCRPEPRLQCSVASNRRYLFLEKPASKETVIYLSTRRASVQKLGKDEVPKTAVSIAGTRDKCVAKDDWLPTHLHRQRTRSAASSFQPAQRLALAHLCL